MHSGQLVLLACQIARSGFSGERVFRLKLADGTEYVGVAPVDYCLRQDQTPVGPEEPAKGERIPGLIEGQVVANGGDLVLVAMPDGETIQVRPDQIAYVRKKATEYVPLGS
jgi:hypothetical protein